MQSMTLAVPEAIASAPCSPLAPLELLTAFARIPDPRRPHGRRFSLSGDPRPRGGRTSCPITFRSSPSPSGESANRPLSLPPSASPMASRRIKRRCNGSFGNSIRCPLAARPHRWFSPPTLPAGRLPRMAGIGVAFDGKAQRGCLACADQPEYPVHMLSAVLHDLGISSSPRHRSTIRGRKAEAETDRRADIGCRA